jgi:hypothetical protein
LLTIGITYYRYIHVRETTSHTERNIMKLENALKKLNKVAQDVRDNGKFIYADYKGYRVRLSYQKAWNGEHYEVCGVHSQSIKSIKSIEAGDVSRAEYDYFTGSYHANLTRCLKFIDTYC